MKIRTKTVPWLLLSCLLAVLAYLPILNNGFIADDYVILARIETLKTQPLYLYQVPPENFRLVSYLIFGVLKVLAGYQAWPFYAVNIGLHVVNIVLLWRLLRTLIEDEMTAGLATLLFAVSQAPQEAIMWLAAMNETTLFLFTLLTLLFWSHKRYLLAATAYSCALFSKESAVIIPVLVLLLDFYQAKRLVWARYVFLLVPTAGFFAIFLLTASSNFMLTSRSYSFGPQAALVIGKSLHRLLWPWFYLFFVLAWQRTRRLPSLQRVGVYLGGVIVTMLPYMFIAYQTSLPSRQLYLASGVLMTLFAVLLRPLRGGPFLSVAVVAFVAFNVGYLWLRKDGQFEERAAPTTQLINVLRQHDPQRIFIKNFAYPYPEIATSVTLAVPGWEPSLVSTNSPDPGCTDCLTLAWNGVDRQYESTERH
jgi:hypothetical protein